MHKSKRAEYSAVAAAVLLLVGCGASSTAPTAPAVDAAVGLYRLATINGAGLPGAFGVLGGSVALNRDGSFVEIDSVSGRTVGVGITPRDTVFVRSVGGAWQRTNTVVHLLDRPVYPNTVGSDRVASWPGDGTLGVTDPRHRRARRVRAHAVTRITPHDTVARVAAPRLAELSADVAAGVGVLGAAVRRRRA